jgi:glycerol-3-phosphate dehydrogenase (NAD(P)+)
MPAEQVAVVGSGSMGTALAYAAATAGCHAALWCADAATAGIADERLRGAQTAEAAAQIRVSTALADVVADAPLVIVTVPSSQFRDTARALGELGIAGRALLSSTKGLEPDTFARMSEILAQETGAAGVGVIAGANITPELVAGRLSAVVVASHVPQVGDLAKGCLESPQLRVGLHEDLASIELAAALKNVVAVGVGIATGLDLGFNARAIVFSCGLQEIAALGAVLGAKPAVFAGLVGAGDLFLTASSPDALNRRLGIELGRGARLADIVAGLPEIPEGIASARACSALARRHGLNLPIAEAIAAIVDGTRKASALDAACREAPLT